MVIAPTIPLLLVLVVGNVGAFSKWVRTHPIVTENAQAFPTFACSSQSGFYALASDGPSIWISPDLTDWSPVFAVSRWNDTARARLWGLFHNEAKGNFFLLPETLIAPVASYSYTSKDLRVWKRGPRVTHPDFVRDSAAIGAGLLLMNLNREYPFITTIAASQDEGATWETFNVSGPQLTSLKYEKGLGLFVSAANVPIGDAGNGIYASADGRKWTLLANCGFEQASTTDFAFNPANSRQLLMAVSGQPGTYSEGSVQLSLDGGHTCRTVLTSPNFTQGGRGFASIRWHGEVVLVLQLWGPEAPHKPPQQWLVSHDGGLNFVPFHNPSGNDLDVPMPVDCPLKPGLWVDQGVDFLNFTTDVRNWTSVPTGPSWWALGQMTALVQGPYKGSEHLILTGFNYNMVTADGVSFAQQTPCINSQQCGFATTPQLKWLPSLRLWVSTFDAAIFVDLAGSDMYRSTDLDTWESMPTPPAFTPPGSPYGSEMVQGITAFDFDPSRQLWMVAAVIQNPITDVASTVLWYAQGPNPTQEDYRLAMPYLRGEIVRTVLYSPLHDAWVVQSYENFIRAVVSKVDSNGTVAAFNHTSRAAPFYPSYGTSDTRNVLWRLGKHYFYRHRKDLSIVTNANGLEPNPVTAPGLLYWSLDGLHWREVAVPDVYRNNTYNVVHHPHASSRYPYLMLNGLDGRILQSADPTDFTSNRVFSDIPIPCVGLTDLAILPSTGKAVAFNQNTQECYVFQK